jgi:type III pantothenate kinase
MNLALDVGNTEIAAGLFRERRLVDSWRLATDRRRTSDEYGAYLHHLIGSRGEISTVTIASVVPSLLEVLDAASRRAFGVRPLAVDADSGLPIRLEVDEPRTVGADRIVNTLAASRLYRTDTIVVDLGTATTYDCVTGDGAFLGGVIAPGVRTAAEHLTGVTAKLPRVELIEPECVIGRRTETCIQSGIFFGAVDAIDGTVQRILEEWQRERVVVVATGGLAPMLAARCRTIDFVEPALTLYGIEMAREALTGGGGG